MATPVDPENRMEEIGLPRMIEVRGLFISGLSPLKLLSRGGHGSTSRGEAAKWVLEHHIPVVN